MGPRLAFVWTRKLDGEPMVGRLRVAHAIRSALSAGGEVASFRLPSMVTDRTVGRILGGVRSLAGSYLRGAPLPLQCAIFADRGDLRAICRSIPADVEAVYLDGVRCFELLRLLRRERPALKLIVDFDDLMSRRMKLLLAADEPLSPGYMTQRLPPLLRRLATSRVFGRAIVFYESRTLEALERRVLTLADAVVLLSAEDAAALEGSRTREPRARATIATVPPAMALGAAKPVTAPLRFVFVGTDTLTQNRLTIDYLLRLWGRERIATPLHIFGHQTRGVPLPPGVTMPGYVTSLDEIHDGHSVLLTPSLLRGGIKTKVLEAFSFGTPVIGNSQTFESLPIGGDYPLRIDDESALLELLREPDHHRETFRIAAERGRSYLLLNHAPDVFAERWRRLMGVQASVPS
jgi:hypothetical protein